MLLPLLVMPRCSVKMQSFTHTQQGYSHGAEVVWTLAGVSGVVGFNEVADACSMWRTLLVEQPLRTGVVPTPLEVEIALNINERIKDMAADVSAMGGSAASIYQQDYRYLPYALRNDEMMVLSRWNMASPTKTVSRVQCRVQVSVDGAAILTSCGKGPTLWRVWGEPWTALHKDERHVLADGEQVRACMHLPAPPHIPSRRGTSWPTGELGLQRSGGGSIRVPPAEWNAAGQCRAAGRLRSAGLRAARLHTARHAAGLRAARLRAGFAGRLDRGNRFRKWSHLLLQRALRPESVGASPAAGRLSAAGKLLNARIGCPRVRERESPRAFSI